MRITITLAAEEAAELKRIAQQEQVSLSLLSRLIVRKYLEYRGFQLKERREKRGGGYRVRKGFKEVPSE